MLPAGSLNRTNHAPGKFSLSLKKRTSKPLPFGRVTFFVTFLEEKPTKIASCF